MNLTENVFVSNNPTRAWWLQAGASIRKKVLIIGPLRQESVELVCELAKKVSWLDGPIERSAKLPATNNLEILTKLDSKYNVVIIESLDGYYCTEILSKLYINYLLTKGKILILEQNETCFSNTRKNSLRSLADIIAGNRKKSIQKACPNGHLKYFCSHIREGTVRQSFVSGIYQNNMNSFLVREKFKTMLINSWLHSYFHNSSLWIISNESIENDLDESIKNAMLQSNIIEASADFRCASLFYKSGKLILTFRSAAKKQLNIVVVLVLSPLSMEQRNNEYESIKIVFNIPELQKYIQSRTMKCNFLGFRCYVMKATAGLIVDMPSKKLSLMMKNVSMVILEMAKYSRVEANPAELANVLHGYANKITERMPGSQNQINTIMSYVDMAVSGANFPVICMHGDAKLENFVLSKKFEVEGIIDWELCAIRGFPLLDLIYLIVYNNQTIHGRQFGQIFKDLWENNLSSFENGLINEYCSEMNISNKDKTLLKTVFFIHHFGVRLILEPRYENATKTFLRSLNDLVDFISRD